MIDQFAFSRCFEALFHHRSKPLLLAEIVLHRLIKQVAAVAVHRFGDGVQMINFLRGNTEADDARRTHNTTEYAVLRDPAKNERTRKKQFLLTIADRPHFERSGRTFGVMANLAGERAREIGVRPALGAQREDVSRMILRRAGLLKGAGVCIGLVLAFGLAQRARETLLPSCPESKCLVRKRTVEVPFWLAKNSRHLDMNGQALDA